MKDLERYAQASIGQDGYRYTVRGNADVPGCVDLVVEEWSSADHRWQERPVAGRVAIAGEGRGSGGVSDRALVRVGGGTMTYKDRIRVYVPAGSPLDGTTFRVWP